MSDDIKFKLVVKVRYRQTLQKLLEKFNFSSVKV